MNAAIIGIGGVGGYFGGKLTQLLPEEKDLKIYFVARGKHLQEIKSNGLVLDTDDGQYLCKPTLATSNINDLPLLDIVLVCVKSYSLYEVLEQLKPKMQDTTLVLPLLNGVDIYERIRSLIHNGVVFPSCVYVGTHVEKPGKVTQRGGASTIVFGVDPKVDMRPEVIFDLFAKAGIKYKWINDPYPEIWGKYIFIASFGMVTACFNRTIGEVLESPELSSYVRSIMEEVIAISSKKGINLPASAADDAFKKAQGFPYDTKTSFQRDFENLLKPDERDLFGGTIIRMGKQHGSLTPVTQKIYDSIMEKKPVV